MGGLLTQVKTDDLKKLLDESCRGTELHFLIYLKQILTLTREEDIKQILKDFHDLPTGGHEGVERMMSRVSDKYRWKGMKERIRNYVRRCETCQKNKHSRAHKMAMQITSTARRPFERIAIDLVGPLPETEEGFKYLLTYQDNLSKFGGAIAIKDAEASTVARNFVHQVILRFGMTEGITVLSDQGANFQSDLFKNVCKLLKIKRVNSSPYHPETNGALEKSHFNIKSVLRTLMEEKLGEWDRHIDFVMFTMNTTKNRATGYTPFELVYGYRAEIPTSLKITPEPLYNYDNYYYELKYKFQRAHQIARDNQITEKHKTKDIFDRKIHPVTFSVGDKVWMKNFGKKGMGLKLQPLFVGPFTITEIISDVNVKVRVGNKEKILHHNILKRYYEPEGSVESPQ